MPGLLKLWVIGSKVRFLCLHYMDFFNRAMSLALEVMLRWITLAFVFHNPTYLSNFNSLAWVLLLVKYMTF